MLQTDARLSGRTASSSSPTSAPARAGADSARMLVVGDVDAPFVPLPHDLLVFGEVGLSGEIRPVPSGQERLKEAAKHGFKRAIVPKGNAPKDAPPGLQIIAVTRLEQALDALVRQLRGEPANDVAVDVESLRAQSAGLAVERGEM